MQARIQKSWIQRTSVMQNGSHDMDRQSEWICKSQHLELGADKVDPATHAFRVVRFTTRRIGSSAVSKDRSGVLPFQRYKILKNVKAPSKKLQAHKLDVVRVLSMTFVRINVTSNNMAHQYHPRWD